MEGFPFFPVSRPAAKSGRATVDDTAPWWTPPTEEEIEQSINEVRAAAEHPDADAHREMIAKARTELRMDRVNALVEQEEAKTWWKPPTAFEIATTEREFREAQESPNAPAFRERLRQARSALRQEEIDRLVRRFEKEAETDQ